jgi:hypothetical protein
VLYELGSVTGPVIGGAAMDVMGPHGMLVMVGGAALGFLLVAAFGPAARSAQAPD